MKLRKSSRPQYSFDTHQHETLSNCTSSQKRIIFGADKIPWSVCQELNSSAVHLPYTGDNNLDAIPNILSPASFARPSCFGDLALGDVYKLILWPLCSIATVLEALSWLQWLPVCPLLVSLHHTYTDVPYKVANPTSLFSATLASSLLFWLPCRYLSTTSWSSAITLQ